LITAVFVKVSVAVYTEIVAVSVKVAEGAESVFVKVGRAFVAVYVCVCVWVAIPGVSASGTDGFTLLLLEQPAIKVQTKNAMTNLVFNLFLPTC